MARETKKYKLLGNLRPQDLKPLGIGIELSALIGGMAYGGYWLDEQWGTGPWLLLAGVCLGTFGGGWHALKMANGGRVPDIGIKAKSKPTEGDGDAAEDEKPTP